MATETPPESKFDQTLKDLVEQIVEQAWFQNIKSHWDELDPQIQTYVKWGTTAVGTLAAIGVTAYLAYASYKMKSEYRSKVELLSLIQASSQLLRESGSADEEGGGKNWGQYFRQIGSNRRLAPTSISVGSPQPGTTDETTQEELLKIDLNRVNIKQLVEYTYDLENGSAPVKLRHLKIERQDAEGWLNASLHVSAFSIKE